MVYCLPWVILGDWPPPLPVSGPGQGTQVHFLPELENQVGSHIQQENQAGFHNVQGNQVDCLLEFETVWQVGQGSQGHPHFLLVRQVALWEFLERLHHYQLVIRVTLEDSVWVSQVDYQQERQDHCPETLPQPPHLGLVSRHLNLCLVPLVQLTLLPLLPHPYRPQHHHWPSQVSQLLELDQSCSHTQAHLAVGCLLLLQSPNPC